MKIKKAEFMQALKFTLFSISAGVIQFASSALLKMLILEKFIPDTDTIFYITELNKNTFIADTIGLALSILWNFTLNRKFTFKAANNVPIAMLLAFSFYIPFYHFQIWYVDAIEKELASIGDWGFIIGLGTCMIINFILEFLWQKFVVFRKPKKTAEENVDETFTDEIKNETNEAENVGDSDNQEQSSTNR